MSVLTEIKNRGVEDVCILVYDGLRGLPDAVTTTWPLTTVQACLLHLIRNTFRYASRRDWDAIGKQQGGASTSGVDELVDVDTGSWRAPAARSSPTIMTKLSQRLYLTIGQDRASKQLRVTFGRDMLFQAVTRHPAERFLVARRCLSLC